jgi:hypothetical protein
MERIKELLNEIETLTTSFMTDANSNLDGNKAAGRRARKATLTLTKLYKEFRNLTIHLERGEE